MDDVWDMKYIYAILKSIVATFLLVVVFLVFYFVYYIVIIGSLWSPFKILNNIMFYTDSLILFAFVSLYFVYKAKKEDF